MAATMTEMAKTMERQPQDLRRMLADWAPVEAGAARIAGRRVFVVGTGTSWHAANQGAYFLRLAGADAWAVSAADCALWGPRPTPADALVLLSHRGTKRYTRHVLERARGEGIPTVAIGGEGAPGGDIETVSQETSGTFTASHLGALARLAQLAVALGAELGDLDAVPAAVAAALQAPKESIRLPERGLEFVGAGPNQWTAAEGARADLPRRWVAGPAPHAWLRSPPRSKPAARTSTVSPLPNTGSRFPCSRSLPPSSASRSSSPPGSVPTLTTCAPKNGERSSSSARRSSGASITTIAGKPITRPDQLRDPLSAASHGEPVAHLWYKYGMARVRVSTTVDEQLLTRARQARSELTDSALIDEALGALLARNRTAEIDDAYAAYDRAPLDAEDEWGDLASFRTAAAAS